MTQLNQNVQIFGGWKPADSLQLSAAAKAAPVASSAPAQPRLLTYRDTLKLSAQAQTQVQAQVQAQPAGMRIQPVGLQVKATVATPQPSAQAPALPSGAPIVLVLLIGIITTYNRRQVAVFGAETLRAKPGLPVSLPIRQRAPTVTAAVVARPRRPRARAL